MTLTDADYMARALFHAARGRGRTSPNPVVGAVVVSSEGVVVGQGFHKKAGEPHAEVHALEMAGERARGRRLCTARSSPAVTPGEQDPAFPASPMPASRASSLPWKIPNPLVRGQGFAYLASRGICVEVGLGVSSASALNQPFFTTMREGRPFVILKAAISLDGCLAEAPGQANRAHVRRGAPPRPPCSG